MSEFLNLPYAEQFDIMNSLLASIASNKEGGIDIESWKDLQRIVRIGLHKTFFKVGDVLRITYNGAEQLVDVIGIDHDVPADKNFKHSLTIQTRDCLGNMQFSAPQALYKAKSSPLLPGTYNIKVGDKKYQFTITTEVPVGGVITFPWAYETDILTTKPGIYESQTSTTPIETVSISEGSAGMELTEINDINRCRYGSNNYVESAIRQWLNSDEAEFIWEPQTDFDRPPTSSAYGSGFLHKLDPDLVAVIGKVEKRVARNTVTDEGGQDIFEDKVFLLSRVEVGGGSEGTTTGEEVYPFYDGVDDAGRIKLLNNSPRYWRLRSPNPGGAYNVRSVSTSGAVNSSTAYSAYGLSPACAII